MKNLLPTNFTHESKIINY